MVLQPLPGVWPGARPLLPVAWGLRGGWWGEVWVISEAQSTWAGGCRPLTLCLVSPLAVSFGRLDICALIKWLLSLHTKSLACALSSSQPWALRNVMRIWILILIFDLLFYLPLYNLESNVALFYLLHLRSVTLEVGSAAILFIHQADWNKKEKHWFWKHEYWVRLRAVLFPHHFP